MKIKTAEAISYGKVFVGSTESLHGYYEEMPKSIINKLIFQCDTVEDYLKAFSEIADREVEKQNNVLVELYKTKYSSAASYNIMKKIMEETMGKEI